MYLQLGKGIFDGLKVFIGWTRKVDLSTLSAADHSYKRLPIENRGPCPGLNMLANHGYLPRDGKNITHDQLIAALVSTNMTATWATIIGNPIFPLLGTGKNGTFSLTDLRKHDVFEHDTSLTRFDFRQGDNFTFQHSMLQDLIGDANGGPITYKTLATTRARRLKENKAAGNADVPMYLKTFAILECAGLLGFLGKSITPEAVTIFFVEERLVEPGKTKVSVWTNVTTLLKIWWNI